MTNTTLKSYSEGQTSLLTNITWSEFEQMLEELGEHRSARLSYSQGYLEIMVPLLEHEKDKEIISYMVQILLETLSIDFEALGSTTFKNAEMKQAVEPDACFYINNYQAVIGKNKLDLTIDPPPDLAIEIDITSRTKLDNYRLLKVPELWRYHQTGLHIYLLKGDNYQESSDSAIFPTIPVIELVNQTVKESQRLGRSQGIKEFKNWLKENLS
ncbi:MAG: Uma2 family endonuclease [Xenococcus sp. (in: cyanobacteria)]